MLAKGRPTFGDNKSRSGKIPAPALRNFRRDATRYPEDVCSLVHTRFFKFGSSFKFGTVLDLNGPEPTSPDNEFP
ncbi:hypothetical protein KKC1_05050 [Calderihabitans maritimus]|uniref:Uncharacterized protein n=1 Tax=Calderihabitans maritimus TaxID=1246530 RepID=A0A1Z5HPA3_9FIRM|nr:hypothetical protein KKC1_05050 [Calderihabitans maritimus]